MNQNMIMMSKVGKVMNKVFLDKVWAPKCGKKVDPFSKAGLALGLELGLGLAFKV